MDPSLKLVVITDLDGTLLDQRNYSYEGSLDAIHRLKSLNIPLVLCSSKTRAEMLDLWHELELEAPFIVENGGAICMPPGYFSHPVKGATFKDSLEILALGTDIATLRLALSDAVRQTGVQVSAFGGMSARDIDRLTGLGPEASARAALREYDEPFTVDDGNAEDLARYLHRLGYTVTVGDRFSHLTRGSDKGRAVSRLLELYRSHGSSIVSIGLGNSANDIPLLAHVDRPIVVKNPDGSWDPAILKAIPTAHRTQGIGPRGWAEAIGAILASMEFEE